MDYADFYDIATYLNEVNRNIFTPKEVAQNAYDYVCEYEYSKTKGKPTETMADLIELLEEENNPSEEVKYWIDLLQKL